MTPERLAEIRFAASDQWSLDGEDADELLNEVDRLTADRDHWKGHAEERWHALQSMMQACNEERVRADVAEREVNRLRVNGSPDA